MLFPVAGSKLYIGGERLDEPDFDAEAQDFDGETWVPVSELDAIGTVGGEWETDSEVIPGGPNMEPGWVAVHKVARGGERMRMVMAPNLTAPGQAAILAAYKSEHAFAWRLVFPDQAGGSGAPQRRWFAKVVRFSEVLDAANSAILLAVDSVIVSQVVHDEGE